YRGASCGYTGPPVAKEDGTPTNDPSLDQCGGRLSDCKLRFGDHGELPFGGFPGSSLIQR
ncbi:phage minor tail protein L, partial [Vibrio agarivorans]